MANNAACQVEHGSCIRLGNEDMKEHDFRNFIKQKLARIGISEADYVLSQPWQHYVGQAFRSSRPGGATSVIYHPYWYTYAIFKDGETHTAAALTDLELCGFPTDDTF